MNKLKLLLAVLVLITFADKAGAQSIPAVTAGQVKQLVDTSTGPVIVNFWASWCGPCVRELAYFEDYVAEASPAVKLYLVSLDLPSSYPKKLQEFVKLKGYKSPVLYLSDLDTKLLSQIIDKQWTGEIPASIFVDNGKGYYKLWPMQLTEPRLKLELQQMLK